MTAKVSESGAGGAVVVVASCWVCGLLVVLTVVDLGSENRHDDEGSDEG